MIRPNRQNTIWLSVLGVLIAITLVAGGVAAEVRAALLGIFILAMAASFIDPRSLNVRQALARRVQSPLRRTRMSPQAQEAVSRAQGRGYYRYSELTLVDVGMIATQSSAEGMAMRRARAISKDDDGVRPFITLQVPPSETDRHALVRFEIIDQNGRELYVHEMRVYLRDGEVNVLSDHHLPLMKNQQVEGSGEWDLRVHIDGTLTGIHTFSLTPSYDDRRRRLTPDGGRYFVTGDAEQSAPRRDDGDVPLTLEDLLRGQGQEQQGRSDRA